MSWEIESDKRYKEAVASVRRRVPMKRDEFDELSTAERQNAFTVAEVTRARVLQQVLDAVDRAVDKGTSFEDFQDEVADSLVESWSGEIPGRLENIFRTNVLTSYADGRHAVNNAPAVREARPYWRYDDVEDDKECDECNACSGVVLPADDPWWATHHPLLHYQCRCTVTALSPEEAEEEGIADAGPEIDADEGFGDEPTSSGDDWGPNLDGLSDELREVIEARLAKGEG
jgi:SPP1 gp7 family putative phage head morphogenesis protein